MTAQDLLALPQPPADHTIAYGPAPPAGGRAAAAEGPGAAPGRRRRARRVLGDAVGLRPRARPGRRADRGGLRDLEPRVPPDRRPRRRLAGHARGRRAGRRSPARGRGGAPPRPRPGGGSGPLGGGPPRPLARRPHRGCRKARRSGPSGRFPLRGVVSLAGITDLRAGAEGRVCGDAIPQLLGGPPRDHPDRLGQSSPIELLPLGLPARLVCGARDPVVPIEQARSYEAAARKAGDPVAVEVVEGAGHFELVDPRGPAWPVVRDAVRSLLER